MEYTNPQHITMYHLKMQMYSCCGIVVIPWCKKGVSSRGSESLIIRLPARGYLRCQTQMLRLLRSLTSDAGCAAQRARTLLDSKIARGLQRNYSSCLMPATHCACYCYYYYFVARQQREFYAFGDELMHFYFYIYQRVLCFCYYCYPQYAFGWRAKTNTLKPPWQFFPSSVSPSEVEIRVWFIWFGAFLEHKYLFDIIYEESSFVGCKWDFTSAWLCVTPKRIAFNHICILLGGETLNKLTKCASRACCIKPLFNFELRCAH